MYTIYKKLRSDGAKKRPHSPTNPSVLNSLKRNYCVSYRVIFKNHGRFQSRQKLIQKRFCQEVLWDNTRCKCFYKSDPIRKIIATSVFINKLADLKFNIRFVSTFTGEELDNTF